MIIKGTIREKFKYKVLIERPIETYTIRIRVGGHMNPDPIDPRLNQSQYRVLRYLAISEDPEGDYLSPTQLRNWHYPELRFWQPKTLLQILGKLAKFEYAYVSGHPGNRKWKISEKGHNYLRFMELDREV